MQNTDKKHDKMRKWQVWSSLTNPVAVDELNESDRFKFGHDNNMVANSESV